MSTVLTTERQKKFENDLSETHRFSKFKRDPATYQPHTVLMSLQPMPALLGAIGCLVTFVFCSATWWYSQATVLKVAVAYAAQFIVLTIFVTLKVIRFWKRSRASGEESRRSTSRTVFSDFSKKLNDLSKVRREEFALTNSQGGVARTHTAGPVAEQGIEIDTVQRQITG